MDEFAERQHLQNLAQQLAGSLEHLRDALQTLSLSLKDSQLELNPDAARAAQQLANNTLRTCARPPLQPPVR